MKRDYYERQQTKSAKPLFFSIIGIIVIMILSVIKNHCHAEFTDIQAPNNRNYLASVPDNFNGSIVLFLHGATMDASRIINDEYTGQLVKQMLDNGFGVIVPEARQGFGEKPFYNRWESESVKNPDTDYLNYILDNERLRYNASVSRDKLIKRVFIIGGSSGALMASRMATSRQDIEGIVLMNGGDADQISLANGRITVNPNFVVPQYHCPVLSIASTNDNIFTMPERTDIIKKARRAGVSSMNFVDPAGDHYWNDWMLKYHDNIIGWMMR